MARIDGVHGPKKKPTIGFIDEWSKLKGALYTLSESVLVNPGTESPVITVSREAIGVLLDQVPRLMDAYAELWELMEGVIKAREQQEASKNDLYVPDAAEMVANANRIRR